MSQLMVLDCLRIGQWHLWSRRLYHHRALRLASYLLLPLLEPCTLFSLQLCPSFISHNSVPEFLLGAPDG